MRIIIDMQGAQTESRFRGIGRYTLSLAQAIVRNRGEHEIILALNGLFTDTIEPIRAAFDSLLPQENIRVWYAPGPVRECEPGNEWRRGVAERVREAFLANLRPDAIFIPSFFEGYQDDGVISIGVFAPNPKTVIAVDNLDSVLMDDANLSQRSHMLRRLEYLKRAALLLVLPPLVADEVSQCLGVPQERVKTGITISEAEANLSDAVAAACNLLQIFEEITTVSPQAIPLPLSQRPKLAFVSPLPPERSGIADYSAELLPELSRHYDIDVIVAQDSVSDPWINANCALRSPSWFRLNAALYDRVLYHFGNSHFHQHMFSLLEHVPGVVVLHDFFLGNIAAHIDVTGYQPGFWAQALYQGHGYAAVQERFHASDYADVVWRYPCNTGVLRGAQGIVVHSENTRRLADEWYGKGASGDWAVVPLLRVPELGVDRTEARRQLRLSDKAFVVCSFGLLGLTKLNHRLLNAWLGSTLAKDANCVLVFVGENHGGDYGTELVATIRRSGLDKRIRITGWADTNTFRYYLAAADVGVQLRTLSRGETSGAVLDCMNYGLPTIVNANGSMADLLDDGVWKLPDEFSDSELIEALETLRGEPSRRRHLGARARDIILTRHAPRDCADQYAEAIEQFHARAQSSATALVKAIADIEGYCPTDAECLGLAQSIANSLPIAKTSKQLLVDVSATCRNDLKTGIQRVVRSLVRELVQVPPQGYRVEPVYLTDEGGEWHYRYARDWTLRGLGVIDVSLQDDPVEHSAGDLMLIADFTGGYAVAAERVGVFDKLKINGIGLHFVVYDLLPVQMPHAFPPGAFAFLEWLNAMVRVADRAICISQTVAEDLRMWIESSRLPRTRPIKIDWFHLGADIESSIPTRGFPPDSNKILARVGAAPSFLMVGTIEPRKGYLQTLDAFTQLWRQGLDINLVIVGNEGWKGLANDLRRTIPEIVGRLRTHPELGKRLLWLSGVSDEYLEKVYAASACLIAASEGEGFGLPLIEAAQHKLPIIARDIPVFREVAEEHAHYFSGLEPQALADSVKNWLALNAADKAPQSVGMPWLTWKESALQLTSVLFHRNIGDIND